MITQDERDKLNQWYADYSANNAKPMDYVTWLEYMLIHRSSLLQQSAEYTDSLEEALKDTRGFVRSIFPLENPSDIRYANQYMQGMIAKWDMVESEAE